MTDLFSHTAVLKQIMLVTNYISAPILYITHCTTITTALICFLKSPLIGVTNDLRMIARGFFRFQRLIDEYPFFTMLRTLSSPFSFSPLFTVASGCENCRTIEQARTNGTIDASGSETNCVEVMDSARPN